MTDIVRYTADRKAEWDAFVKDSKNGTFLFLRDYMEYHKDRFEDHSLMYYKDGRLLALLPANRKGDALWSHQGLTYGGFVLGLKAHAAEVGEMFDVTLEHLRAAGIKEWYYKQIPTVYHQLPAEDDSYWLWRHGAETVECNLMSATDLNTDYNISSRRRTYASKLKREGWKIVSSSESTLLRRFWTVLSENLKARYGAKPVHSLEEIENLQRLFPDNIVCQGIESPEGTLEAGVLMFLSNQVARTQYISASPEGKASKALDCLFIHLLEHYKNAGYHFFDMGTSMDEDSTHLNDGLVAQKEGFGARGIACRIYKLTIS
ncbi:MAG: GNAT family N-acetyltransferase [Prevotellaceae bacterium]|nr:GNAT family N-acetyltransferase [Prevotellaceae bacterium]